MRFYGQFDPPVDKALFERYFSDYPKLGFFIECGAFDGMTECSCKFFEETLHWTGINIEPAPPVFSQLERNRPNSLNLNVALSNRSGVAQFKHVIHPYLGDQFGNGSLCHAPEHMQLLIDTGCKFKEYNVRTITWPDLVNNYNIKRVDLFILDVEGAELAVIEGMKGCTVLPKIFCIEHEHIDINKLKELLGCLGYRYDFSLFINSFFVHETARERFVREVKEYFKNKYMYIKNMFI